MKRNRVAVGQLATAHSFLMRVCRDETCLAGVRPKMVEKLQNCASQWHDSVAATSKRDKLRAVNMKMREHSLAQEADLANAARLELEELRATKTGDFNPQVIINETSSVQKVEQAIRVCADAVAEAVSEACFAFPQQWLVLDMIVVSLHAQSVPQHNCSPTFSRCNDVLWCLVSPCFACCCVYTKWTGDCAAKRDPLDRSIFGELGKEVVDDVSVAVRHPRLSDDRNISHVRYTRCLQISKHARTCPPVNNLFIT